MYGNINVQCSFFCPSELEPLRDVRWIVSAVTEAIGNEITIENRVAFTNGTVETSILSGNVETGNGNLTYPPIYYLVAGGLTAGDQIYNTPTAPTINYTVPTSVVAVFRPVNFLVQSGSTYGVQYTIKQGWDQEKGVLVQAFFTSTVGISGSIYLTDSVWFHPLTAGDFTLAANPGHLTMQPSKNAVSTITVTSIDNFAGDVYLSATAAGLNVSPEAGEAFGPRAYLSPSAVALTKNNSATSILTVQTSSLPSTGDYVIMITGWDGRLEIHSLNITLTIRPSATTDTGPTPGPTSPGSGQEPDTPLILGLSPIQFYSITGATIAVLAAATTLLVFSRRRKVSDPRTETDF